MANYTCAVRTNYFHIRKSADEFAEFIGHVMGCEDDVQLWVKNADGEKTYGFGCYGGIIGVAYEDAEDYDYGEAWDCFVKGLQEFVADDDAILIMESGNEKLRYVSGLVTIITREDCETIDMVGSAVDRARELLGYSWNTHCAY